MRVSWLLPLAIFAAGFAHSETAAITDQRIATLPAAWREYIDRSRAEMAADENGIYAELERERLIDWSAPPTGKGVAALLKNPDEWFASDESRRIADNVISFQTPAGGWGKGTEEIKRARLAGERFSGGASGWSYVGTFDNGATITELRFLARAASTYPPARAALLRGLEYVLAAQFPSGGWPQVYPLMGGYHDAITFNDTAMVNVLALLQDVARGKEGFSDLHEPLRARARGAVERGIACLLATQIHGTGWAQQHDAITLEPAPARAFEPTALASAETTGIMRFLMDLEAPSPAVIAAVHGSARWLRKVEIPERSTWARFYEIGSDRPLFGDRDGSVHYDVSEISRERREGYAWFSNSPESTLKKFEKWAKKFPLKP